MLSLPFRRLPPPFTAVLLQVAADELLPKCVEKLLVCNSVALSLFKTPLLIRLSAPRFKERRADRVARCLQHHGAIAELKCAKQTKKGGILELTAREFVERKLRFG